MIKLAAGAGEDEHLQLLGLLNSAVACFWMKQVFHKKTQAGGGGGSVGAEFSHQHEFDGTKLKQFPVVDGSVLGWSARLDGLAQELGEWLPGSLFEREVPSAELLVEPRARVAELRAEMLWLQEELDWRCAFLYSVTERDLSLPPEEAFGLNRGQRAFEIALARRIAAGEAESTWFERHGSTPIVDPPSEWPDWYREVVEERLELIDSDRVVNLLERPEYKRRWNWDSWDDLAEDALREWLLTRLEDARFWPLPEPRSVAQLADVARTDAEFVEVAELYRQSPEVDLAELIAELTAGDAVPFLAAWRYKDSGLRKRASWEHTWGLQRREDAGEDVGKIPVPPKYTSSDFASTVFLAVAGQAGCAEGAVHLLPGHRTRRGRLCGVGVGWLGSPRPGEGADGVVHPADAERGVGRRAVEADPGGVGGAGAVAQAVAQRLRPEHRPGSG